MWLKERKPESLRQAMELADDYALVRGTGRSAGRKSQAVDPPAAGSTGGRADASKPSFHATLGACDGK